MSEGRCPSCGHIQDHDCGCVCCGQEETMSHDSMAWLGCALWLADMGYPADVAAKAAGPILAAFKEAASDGV